MRRNANDIIYDEVTLLGTPALFTDWRVDRATIPTGMFLYEVRHADSDWDDPCQLAWGILVNFYGTVLTAQPMDISESGYLNFDNEDWVYAEEDTCSAIPEFLKKYGVKEGTVNAQYDLWDLRQAYP